MKVTAILTAIVALAFNGVTAELTYLYGGICPEVLWFFPAALTYSLIFLACLRLQRHPTSLRARRILWSGVAVFTTLAWFFHFGFDPREFFQRMISNFGTYESNGYDAMTVSALLLFVGVLLPVLMLHTLVQLVRSALNPTPTDGR